VRVFIPLTVLAVAVALVVPTSAQARRDRTSVVFASGLSATINVPASGCPCPVVILIHGGSWKAGSSADWGKDRTLFTEPAYGSWVTMAINYRLAPAFHAPTQENDVRAAVAWAQSHIAAYGGDPNRIVLLGSSAGGQIAGLIANDPGAVKAVALWSPPSEFNAECAPLCEEMADYLGPAGDWSAADPRNGINVDTVPTLLANGINEATVKLASTQAWADALTGPHLFLRVPTDEHAKGYEAVKMGGRSVRWRTMAFLLEQVT
jgi:acetyl esterase/lipase